MHGGMALQAVMWRRKGQEAQATKEEVSKALDRERKNVATLVQQLNSAKAVEAKAIVSTSQQISPQELAEVRGVALIGLVEHL